MEWPVYSKRQQDQYRVFKLILQDARFLHSKHPSPFVRPSGFEKYLSFSKMLLALFDSR